MLPRFGRRHAELGRTTPSHRIRTIPELIPPTTLLPTGGRGGCRRSRWSVGRRAVSVDAPALWGSSAQPRREIFESPVDEGSSPISGTPRDTGARGVIRSWAQRSAPAPVRSSLAIPILAESGRQGRSSFGQRWHGARASDVRSRNLLVLEKVLSRAASPRVPVRRSLPNGRSCSPRVGCVELAGRCRTPGLPAHTPCRTGSAPCVRLQPSACARAPPLGRRAGHSRKAGRGVALRGRDFVASTRCRRQLADGKLPLHGCSTATSVCRPGDES